MNNIQVVIYPELFTPTSIRVDGALINCNALYAKAGFFEKIKLRQLMSEFVNLKQALVSNPYHSLIVPNSLMEKVNKYASNGEVLDVGNITYKDPDDGLFDLDFKGKDPNEN